MNMLVAYDIADPKRIAQVSGILKDYGVRVQKSIFEVDVNGGVFTTMKERVEKVIVSAEDGVKYFPLCRKCSGTLEIIGQGVFTDPDEEYYIY